MSGGIKPLIIPATIQLPEMEIEVEVEVDYHAAAGACCVEAVRIGGATIELEQDKLEELSDMILSLYPNGELA